MSKEAVEILIRKGKELFDKPKERIVKFIRSPKYTNAAEAERLLNDFDTYPHAFVIGCIADKQVDADIAWLTPYNVSTQVNDFDIRSLAELSLDDFRRILANATPKHRYHKSVAEEIFLGIHMIIKKYDGDASRIWKNRPSCLTVVNRFLEFKGVGPKISSMATNILAREFKIPFSDYSYIDIDISADRHIKRIFYRLGLCHRTSTPDDIVKIARKLHPEFPGLIDLPIWEIGRELCRETNPLCTQCYLKQFCKQELINDRIDENSFQLSKKISDRPTCIRRSKNS